MRMGITFRCFCEEQKKNCLTLKTNISQSKVSTGNSTGRGVVNIGSNASYHIISPFLWIDIRVTNELCIYYERQISKYFDVIIYGGPCGLHPTHVVGPMDKPFLYSPNIFIQNFIDDINIEVKEINMTETTFRFNFSNLYLFFRFKNTGLHSRNVLDLAEDVFR